MEIWGALIGLTGVAVGGLFQRLPGLTPDDREREHILRDLKLLDLLPRGRSSQEFEEYIEKSVSNLIENRERRRREKPWTWAFVALLLSMLLAVAFSHVPDGGIWPLAEGLLLGLFAGSALVVIIVPLVAIGKFVGRLQFIKSLGEKFRKFLNRWLPRESPLGD